MVVLLLFGMSFIVFASLYITPRDPAQMVAGAAATEAEIANVRASLGLDKPFLVQYGIYLKNLLTLDLGTSYATRQPIIDEIAVRLPITINLATAAILIAVLVGIPLGILTALKRDTWLDNLLTTTSLFGISIPNFWLGTMLMLIFAVKLKWLPTGRHDRFLLDSHRLPAGHSAGSGPIHVHHCQLHAHRAVRHAGCAPV